jgi:hypothetical protein
MYLQAEKPALITSPLALFASRLIDGRERRNVRGK